MFGLICFLELPNFLFTKYKKDFNRKNGSYQDHPIIFFINFAPETYDCGYVDKPTILQPYRIVRTMWGFKTLKITFDNSRPPKRPESYPPYQQTIIIIIEESLKKIFFSFKTNNI